MRGDNTELICRILIFLINVHHVPMIASQILLPILKDLRKVAFEKVHELRVSN